MRDEAVAAVGDEPVFVQDSMIGPGARRAAERVVVLQAAVDVVERLGVVDIDVIELRQGEVLEEHPCAACVETAIEAAVVADEHVIRVLRIHPDDVVVDVHGSLPKRLERLGPIVRDLKDHIGKVDPLRVGRIGEDVAVVHRALVVVGALLPGDAVVGAAINPALAIRGLDVRVNEVRLGRSDGQTDAAELLAGKAGVDLRPRLASIGAAMDGALRAAIDEGEEGTAALIRRRDHDVRVPRIDDHVSHAGVLADLEDLLPRLAAVGRFVKTAISTRRPERPLRGHVDDVAVFRMNDDAPDVFGVLEAHVLPRLASVLRLVHAVAIGD